MELVVLGGTGTLGREVVAEALARGHAVRVASRRMPSALPDGATHHRVDLSRLSREPDAPALATLLTGAEAVIDAVNGGRAVLVEGMAALLRAERAAGVGHHVAISIVGCDLVPFSYYELKARQEAVVAEGPVPWSLQRATQFHALARRLIEGFARVGLRPVSDRVPLQTVDPRAVAIGLVAAAEAGPAGRLTDVGGPAVASLRELSDLWAAHTGSRTLRLPVRIPGATGRAIATRALCLADGGRRVGDGFADWLAARSGGPGPGGE